MGAGKGSRCNSFVDRSRDALFGCEIRNLEGIGPHVPGLGEAVRCKIAESLADKFVMADLLRDTWTGVLSHFPAGLIHKIASEKGPGTAHLGLAWVYSAPLILFKEDTIPAVVAFDDTFGGDYLGILIQKGGQIQIQKFT